MNEHDESSAIADTPVSQVMPETLAGYILGHDTREFRVGENVDGMLQKVRSLQGALAALKNCMETRFYTFAVDRVRRLSEFLGKAENKKALEQCHVDEASGYEHMPYGHALWDWPSLDEELYQDNNYFSLSDFGNDWRVYKCYKIGLIIAACGIESRDPQATEANLLRLVNALEDNPLGPLTYVNELHRVIEARFWYEDAYIDDFYDEWYWRADASSDEFCRAILRAIYPENDEVPSAWSAAMLGAMQILDKSIRRALSQGYPLCAELASQESDAGEEPSHQPPGLHSPDDQSARVFPITQPPENAEPSPSLPDNDASEDKLVHKPDEPRPDEFRHGPIEGQVRDVVPAVLFLTALSKKS